MATPVYGLAYGLGAGTANLPQSYMAGQQAAQGLQYNQMRNDKLAGDIAEEEAMNAALAQGYQIAQEKLGPNASPDELASTAYGHALTAAAQSGKGGAMVQRILPAYTASAEKKRLAEAQRQRQISANILTMEPQTAVPMLNSAFGLDLATLGHDPNRSGWLVGKKKNGADFALPLDLGIAAMSGDREAQMAAMKAIAAGREQASREKIAAEKQKLEAAKFKYKQEVYDPELFNSWKRNAARASSAGKTVAKLEIYSKFYDQARSEGKSHEEADRIGWSRAGGDVSERAMKSLEARAILQQTQPLYKQLAELDPVKDKVEVARIMGMLEPLQSQYRDVLGKGGAVRPSNPQPQTQQYPDGTIISNARGEKMVKRNGKWEPMK